MVAGALVTLPLLPWAGHEMVTAPASAWTSALYLALVPSALGFVLWGLRGCEAAHGNSTSLLFLVSGVAVVIAGAVLIGQGDRLRGASVRRPALQGG